MLRSSLALLIPTLARLASGTCARSVFLRPFLLDLEHLLMHFS